MIALAFACYIVVGIIIIKTLIEVSHWGGK